MSVRNKKFSYYCTNCNCELYTHPVKCPECNSPLNITGRIKYLESNEFNPLNQYRSLWRYFDLLPLSDKNLF